MRIHNPGANKSTIKGTTVGEGAQGEEGASWEKPREKRYKIYATAKTAARVAAL